ncbi:OTU domain-containing protein [Parendozoicomonas haliclonae]|uniref:OTU domain-containing protein n=1 Tax=Parendozoicomonas haliclonae TaxID=1960125 RepID=A0A1X7AMV1_9GAMM|nr:OTU domain-containing protein [Parendozoicomonas haliclonae]SMA49342.1 hypothetical protein EHSB41UT_03194 [Parendozoicomonas haliclonae]
MRTFGHYSHSIFLAVLLLILHNLGWAAGESDLKTGRYHTRSSKAITDDYLQDLTRLETSRKNLRRYQTGLRELKSRLELESLETSPDGSCIYEAVAQQLILLGGKPDGFSSNDVRRDLIATINQAETSLADSPLHHFWDGYTQTINPKDNTPRLLEELRDTQIWGNAYILSPLIAFTYQRPVLHINRSPSSSLPEIQATSATGKDLDTSSWESLIPDNPLYLISNGSGHYEGAYSLNALSRETSPPPTDVVSETTDKPLPPSEQTEPSTTEQDDSVEHTIEIFITDAFSPISSVNEDVPWEVEVRTIHSHDIDTSLFLPLPLKSWQAGLAREFHNYQELSKSFQRYPLRIGMSGITQIAGGFYGALASALYSRRSLVQVRHQSDKERLHDLTMIREIRLLLERTSTTPVLGQSVERALSFCVNGDPHRSPLTRALQELNHFSHNPWKSSCLLPTLASLYNTPILLLSPLTPDNTGMLFLPWQPGKIIRDDNLPEWVGEHQPVTLIHSGGADRFSRWRSTTPHQRKPRHTLWNTLPETRQTDTLAAKAPWLSATMLPMMQNRTPGPDYPAHITIDGELSGALPYLQLLSLMRELFQTPSGSRNPELSQKLDALSWPHTPEWQTALVNLRYELTYRAKDFHISAQLLEKQLKKPGLPRHLQTFLIHELTSINDFHLQAYHRSRALLETYEEITLSSRRLSLMRAVMYDKIHQLEKAVPLARSIDEQVKWDIDVKTSLAALLASDAHTEEGIKTLTDIPNYRHLPKVVRTLASAYTKADEPEKALNLILPVCIDQASTSDMNTLMTALSMQRNEAVLRKSLTFFEHASKNNLGSPGHIVYSRSAVETHLKMYPEAVETISNFYGDQAQKQLYSTIHHFNNKAYEPETAVGLTRAAIKRFPEEYSLVAKLALIQEKNQQFRDAHRTYKKWRKQLDRHPKLSGQALVFYEKHPEMVPELYKKDVPVCESCQIYARYQKQKHRKSGLDDQQMHNNFRQHSQNASKWRLKEHRRDGQPELRLLKADQYQSYLKSYQASVETFQKTVRSRRPGASGSQTYKTAVSSVHHRQSQTGKQRQHHLDHRSGHGSHHNDKVRSR